MELISQMWSLLGLLTVVQNVLPSQILGLLHSAWQSLQDSLSPFSHMDVPEFTSFSTLHPNDLYNHIHLYLHHLLLLPPASTPDTNSAADTTPSPTAAATASPPRLTLSLPRHAPHAHLSLSLAPHNSVEDRFQGHRLLWTHHADPLADSLDERRSFSLRVPKRLARSPGSLRAYLAHVSTSAAQFQASARERRLHTNVHGRAGESAPGTWASVPFRHPATFDTLAMEPGLKGKILADLDSFVNGKEYYGRIGRAWKRGYLLHGPPGSGKSSLIAAVANYLNYDVFDLELTKVADNGELRSLLIQTTNRSVIVIEDIDCSLDLTKERQSSISTTNCSHVLYSDDDDDVEEDSSSAKRHRQRAPRRRSGWGRRYRHSVDDHDSDDGSATDSDSVFGDPSSLDGQKPSSRRVTLSGLLNFTDGLWSCCGEERIIVFTTNHRGAVDPALLRPGRMDVHIRLAHCGPHAFRQMVDAYVGGVGSEDADELFRRADACIRVGGSLTPAEVGEVLLRNRDDPPAAVREAVAQMQARVPTQALMAVVDRVISGGESSEVGSESPQENESWEKGWSTASRVKRRRKEKAAAPTAASWEKKVKFLTRLRSLTKSDSGRRGV